MDLFIKFYWIHSVDFVQRITRKLTNTNNVHNLFPLMDFQLNTTNFVLLTLSDWKFWLRLCSFVWIYTQCIRLEALNMQIFVCLSRNDFLQSAAYCLVNWTTNLSQENLHCIVGWLVGWLVGMCALCFSLNLTRMPFCVVNIFWRKDIWVYNSDIWRIC